MMMGAQLLLLLFHFPLLRRRKPVLWYRHICLYLSPKNFLATLRTKHWYYVHRDWGVRMTICDSRTVGYKSATQKRIFKLQLAVLTTVVESFKLTCCTQYIVCKKTNTRIIRNEWPARSFFDSSLSTAMRNHEAEKQGEKYCCIVYQSSHAPNCQTQAVFSPSSTYLKLMTPLLEGGRAVEGQFSH